MTIEDRTEELLITCARKVLTKGHIERTAGLIKKGVDWNYFCDNAVRTAVTVLIYDSIGKISRHTDVPKFVIERLRSESIVIISRSILEERQLQGMLKCFASENIPAMPLKGPILANRIYGDIAARGLSADLDILVKGCDRHRAIHLLEEMGFHLIPSSEVEERKWQLNFIKYGNLPVDLHWDITRDLRSSTRISALWEGAKAVTKDGVTYYESDEESLLLYLSAHLTASIALRNLRYICDINEFLCKFAGTIDWGSIVKKAGRWRLSASLYTALTVCNKLFDADIPKDIIDRMRPPLAKRVFIRAFANRRFVLNRRSIRKKVMDSFLSYLFFELIEERFSKGLSRLFRELA